MSPLSVQMATTDFLLYPLAPRLSLCCYRLIDPTNPQATTALAALEAGEIRSPDGIVGLSAFRGSGEMADTPSAITLLISRSYLPENN